MSCSFLFFFPGCAALATLLSDGPFFCLLLPNLLVSLSPRIIASGVTKGTGHLPCLPVIAFLGLDWEYREVNFVSKVQVLVGFIWSATGLQNRTGRKNLSTNGAVLQQSYVP